MDKTELAPERCRNFVQIDRGKNVQHGLRVLSRSNGVQNRDSGRRLAGVSSMVGLLLLIGAVGVGSARGNEASEPGPTLGSVPTPQQTKEALQSATSTPLEEASTSPSVAAELPHRELGREEALELVEGVFETQLQSPAGIYDELEVSKFLSNNAAVVPPGALPEPAGQQIGEAPSSAQPQQPMLLESTLPLRTENDEGTEEAVDLSLQHAEGELQPENPLTEIGVPLQLGEGISLPGPDVQIEIPEAAAERGASDVQKTFAFYPNISENTDFIVAPTPTGVETMTDIRSADAPRSQTYELNLPPEATLKATAEGGAEVERYGRTTVSIPPPSATDAAGNQVPVKLKVAGSSLEVSVSPAEDTAYPILVDPSYIVESWHWTLQHDSLAAWSSNTNDPASYQPFPYEHWESNWYPGLDLTTGFWQPGQYEANANWVYSVPRYAEDLSRFKDAPHSWIYQMYNEGVVFLPHGNTSNYPALVLGLVDPNYGWQVDGVHYGGQGEMMNWSNNFTFTNTYEQTGDKSAVMNLITYEYEPEARWRDTYVAVAAIAVADSDAPKILELNPPTGWTTGSSGVIPYGFEDAGLGVRSAVVTVPGETGFHPGWGVVFPCTGATASPCPRVAKSSEAGQPGLGFIPNELPTGRDKLEVTVGDPLWTAGHTATGPVVVKVDHTAPELALSGSLTEQASLGTHRPSYGLRVHATDGTEAAPQSGIAKVEVKVDGNKVTMPEEGEWAPNCQTQNCALSNEWALNASEYSPGIHEVRVIATDAVGITSTKTLTVELHPEVPTVSLSGSITEQATLGTSRPRYKLKVNATGLSESPTPASTPTFSTSFGSLGTGNGQFSHPGDVAIDSKGDLWVLDTGDNRIEEFSSTGAYLAKFSGAGSGIGQFNRPTAIAIDSQDDLWVTDSGNKRVEEFNSAGGYLKQFGSAGLGNGQFAGSGPEGIAIDYHGNVWVSDTYGARLEKFTEGGTFIKSVGSRGAGAGQLEQPDGLDVGPGGNIWVADWGENKVVEFSGSGQYIRQFGAEGAGNGEFKHRTR